MSDHIAGIEPIIWQIEAKLAHERIAELEADLDAEQKLHHADIQLFGAENQRLRQALESVTNVGDRPAVEVARKALAAISELVGDVEPRHTAAYDLADDIRVEVDAALAAIKAPASDKKVLLEENEQLRQALEHVWQRFGYSWAVDKPAPDDERYRLMLEVNAALAPTKAPASEEGLLECPACRAIHKLHVTKALEETSLKKGYAILDEPSRPVAWGEDPERPDEDVHWPEEANR